MRVGPDIWQSAISFSSQQVFGNYFLSTGMHELGLTFGVVVSGQTSSPCGGAGWESAHDTVGNPRVGIDVLG